MRGKLRLPLVIAVAMLALFSLLSIASAAGPSIVPACITAPANSGPPPYTINQCLDWSLPYVAIGLLLSFQVVAIAYLIGEVLNFGGFKGWYQNELWESIKSLALVGIIFAVIMLAGAAASSVSQSYLNQFSSNPGNVCGTTTTAQSSPTVNLTNLYVVSCSYLSNEVSESNDSYYGLLGLAIAAGYLNNFLFQYYTPFLGQVPIVIPTPEPTIYGSINLGANFNFFSSGVLSYDPLIGSLLADTLNFLVYPLMLVIDAQYYVLLVLMSLGLGVLLPLGLVMRAIPFLRPMGATFIAIAIAFIVIYPMMLALFNLPITSYFQQASGFAQVTQQQQFFCPASTLCDIILPSILSISDPLLNSLTPVNDYPSFTAGYYGAFEAFLPGNFLPALNVFFAWIFFPMIVQLLLFIIDIILVVVITQNIASMLGGELRLGIGKMKLT